MNLLRKTTETKALESTILEKIGRQKAAEKSLPSAEAAVEVIANQPVPDDADAGARRARRHQRWAAAARLPKLPPGVARAWTGIRAPCTASAALKASPVGSAVEFVMSAD
jgi:hypothetical protein